MSNSSAAKNASSGEQRRLLVFSLGTSKFAISLGQVKEVIAIPPITSIPNSPAHFLGVTNLRGQIFSIIDLRRKLNVGNKESTKETTVVILDVADLSLGVVVDSVDYVLNLETAEQIAKPTLQRNDDNDCIQGVIHRENALILFLDLAKAINATDRVALEVAAAQTSDIKKAA